MDRIPETRLRLQPNVPPASPIQRPHRARGPHVLLPLRRRHQVRRAPRLQEDQGRLAPVQVHRHDRYPARVFATRALRKGHSRRRQDRLRQDSGFCDSGMWVWFRR